MSNKIDKWAQLYGDYADVINMLKRAEGFVDKRYEDNGRDASGYGFNGQWYKKHKEQGFTRESADQLIYDYIMDRDADFRKRLKGYAEAPKHLRDAALFYSYTRPYFYRDGHKDSNWLKNAIATADMTGVDKAFTLGANDPRYGEALRKRWVSMRDLVANGVYRNEIYSNKPFVYNGVAYPTVAQAPTPQVIAQSPVSDNTVQPVVVNPAVSPVVAIEQPKTPAFDREALSKYIDAINGQNELLVEQAALGRQQQAEANELAKNQERVSSIMSMYAGLMPKRTPLQGANLFRNGGRFDILRYSHTPYHDAASVYSGPSVSEQYGLNGLSQVGINLPMMKMPKLPMPNIAQSIPKAADLPLPTASPTPPGISPLSKGLGVLTGAASLYNIAANNAKIADTSSTEANIEKTANHKIQAETNDEFVDEWNATQQLDKVSYDQVRGNSPGIGTHLSAAATGAGAGSVFGPIGAIVGGGIGLISSGIGSLIGSSKAQRKMKELNRGIENANAQLVRNFSAKAESIDKKNDAALKSNFFAEGGEMNNIEGLQEFDAGGTHEDNPMGGIPLGIGMNGLPNLVEEGETNYNGYIFSNRLKPVSRDFLKAHGLPQGLDGLTFAEISKRLMKESEERPNDPISRRTEKELMAKVSAAQEEVKIMEEIKRMKAMGISPLDAMAAMQAMQGGQPAETGNVFASGGKINPLVGLRYVPALGSAIGSMTDMLGITNKPDYSLLSGYEDYIRSQANKQSMKVQDYTERAEYKPMDMNYQANALRSQNAMTNDAIRQQSGANPYMAMAGLLNSGYKGQLGLAAAFRGAHEQNVADKMRAMDFNRGVHQMNQAARLQAIQYNNSLDAQRGADLLRLAQLKNEERQRAYAGRSANLTNLFNSLGDIGREEFIFEQIKNNPALYYGATRWGGVPYKGK